MRVTSLKKKLAVIGAGAGGLAVLQVFSKHLEIFELTCFEQSDKVGGTWNYTEKVGLNDLGRPLHSSMYRNMKTNLPKEVMAFQDYPFPPHLSSFLRHSDVASYLSDYAEFHQLKKYIKFHSFVKSVGKEDDGRIKIVWEVGKSGDEEDIFDYLVICNGHYTTPYTPDLRGLENFKGDVIHSHNYRKPDQYKARSVLVLGAGPSGVDIADDIASVTENTVLLSHRKPNFNPKMRPNISLVSEMTEIIGSNRVQLANGDTYEVDSIVFCTGYRYNFPFLEENVKLRITNERLYPLYKHLVDARNPNIIYLGITKTVLPFPHFHIQASFAAAVFTNQITLPCEDDMLADIENDYKWRTEELGFSEKRAHYLHQLQWAYNDDLCELASIPRLPSSVSNLYLGVHQARTQDLQHYKEKNYRIVDEHTFVEV
ncbi:DgyrCDS189 [Dimorphilus gyrociliatus]|uniref:Flavin-containing monooxygenase n=1 Tax=Dimorphilus gyrociliatus TaxID=2664684 RepID=A0A7I8V882_9ANNE|nr:DgyrCDS189 [Dimorphilus gyrociliatus]